MSNLFVFSSTSRISGGIIKRIFKTSNYASITCGDLYPNYHAIERFIRLKDSLNVADSATEVTDTKIVGKASLERQIEAADHVLFISHDLYKNTSSKTDLLKTVAELAKNHGKKLVMVTPSEYDHQEFEKPQEVAQQAETEALEKHGEGVLIRPDLTFGEDSQLIHNTVLSRIVNGPNLYLNGNGPVNKRRPVSVDNLTTAVLNALTTDDFNGNKYLLEGANALTIREIINVLEKASGKTANFNPTGLENLINPSTKPGALALIEEQFVTQCYKNCSQLLHSEFIRPEDYQNGLDLLEGVELDTLEGEYPEGSVGEVAKVSGCRVRKFFYD